MKLQHQFSRKQRLSLEAFDQLDGSDDLTVEQITTAFLPDVMRVDTSLDIEPGETAYNHSVSGDKSILTSGGS